MANRIRPVAEKVGSVTLALQQINLAAAAQPAHVPASTLKYDLNKVMAALPDILANRPPGPKAQPHALSQPISVEPATPPRPCPACGGRVRKNGTYWVLNWVRLLTLGWLGVQRVLLQRWRCHNCGHELVSPERARQAEARRAWWQQVNRLIGLSRFKLGLSVRLTQLLVGFIYAREVSIGHIERLTQRVGQTAVGGLAKLKQGRQRAARFLLFDETFPKLASRAYSLGVGMCEAGLIRGVGVVRHKVKDISRQLRQLVGEQFQPRYFLTDLAVLYPECLKRAGLKLGHLRDKVHLIRQIVRLFDEAVRDVTLDVPKGLALKERQKQRRLKQRLLRQQLRPLLRLAVRAFSPGYESICVLLLEGLISQLQDPTQVIQTASVQTLTRRLQRFVNKHGETINSLLHLAVEQGTPTTTNALESKNSLFRRFSQVAKFFPDPARCTAFFAGVALFENFEVKRRGPHQGSSAMQRAEIDLADFGAPDFFSAVGLPQPQISFVNVTD